MLVSIFGCFARQLLAVEAIRSFFDITAKRVPWDCFLFSMLLDKLHEKNCSGHPTVAEFPQLGIPCRRSEFALTQRMIKTDSDPDLVLVFLKKFPL